MCRHPEHCPSPFTDLELTAQASLASQGVPKDRPASASPALGYNHLSRCPPLSSRILYQLNQPPSQPASLPTCLSVCPTIHPPTHLSILFFDIENHSVAQAILELIILSQHQTVVILLPQSPECWDYRCEPTSRHIFLKLQENTKPHKRRMN